jgi:PhnB protein
LNEQALLPYRAAALSDGGKVTMPMSKTFFSPLSGMITNQFGAAWMVIAEQ